MLALLADGSLVSWGGNSTLGFDYLGRTPGSPTDLTSCRTPAPVFGGTNVVSLVGSNTQSGNVMFQKQDGSVWCWGDDHFTMGLGESFSTQLVTVTGFSGTTATVSSLGAGDTANSWFFQNFSVSELLQDSLVADLATPAGDGIPNLI